jgi:hypothetical protein
MCVYPSRNMFKLKFLRGMSAVNFCRLESAKKFPSATPETSPFSYLVIKLVFPPQRSLPVRRHSCKTICCSVSFLLLQHYWCKIIIAVDTAS